LRPPVAAAARVMPQASALNRSYHKTIRGRDLRPQFAHPEGFAVCEKNWTDVSDITLCQASRIDK